MTVYRMTYGYSLLSTVSQSNERANDASLHDAIFYLLLIYYGEPTGSQIQTSDYAKLYPKISPFQMLSAHFVLISGTKLKMYVIKY